MPLHTIRMAAVASSWLLFGCCFVQCSKIEYSPEEVRLHDDEKNLNQKNASRIQNAVPASQENLTFLFMSDSQRYYEETDDFADVASRMTDVNFVLHGGDLTDFGIVKEYRWQNDILKRIPAPYLAVIGNHDCLGNGKKVYEAMYGPMNFAYTFGRNRFVFVNTNSLEFDNGEVPNLSFLDQAFGDTAAYTNAFVVFHVPPFDSEFDRSKEQAFAEKLRGKKVKLALCGHQHSYKELQPYNDGITYLAADNMEDRNFIKITINGSNVQHERITY